MKFSTFLIIATMLSGCTNSTTKWDSAAVGKHTDRAAPMAGKQGTDIVLTLVGGTDAGTYKASSKESTCSIGLSGEKSFGNQYSETGKGEKELSSVQLIGRDYEQAKKGTSGFNLQFGLGSLVNGSSYLLDPANNSGTGKLTVTDVGTAKVATIEGTTKDGIGIRATITCKTVQKLIDGRLQQE